MKSEKSASCRPAAADSALVVACTSSLEQRREETAERRDRNAQRSEGHRRGVGDERQRGRHDGRKAQAREHRRGDCHRRTEPRDALNQRAEAEGDKDDLDAPIAGRPRERAADHVEIAARLRQVVEEDRAQHDPADRPQAECHPMGHRGERQGERHSPYEPREDERGHSRHDCGSPWRDAKHGQKDREENRRDRGDEGRQQDAAADRVVDLLEDVCHGRGTLGGLRGGYSRVILKVPLAPSRIQVPVSVRLAEPRLSSCPSMTIRSGFPLASLPSPSM